LPLKFEAGTTNYVGAIGMAEALKYVEKQGLTEIAAQEKSLLDYATEKLMEIEGLTIYGNAPDKISVISFLIENLHQYDVGMILDKLGVAVRTGTHCTQPVMQHFGITGTIRASMVFYNTHEEIDAFTEALKKAQMMLG